MSASRILNVKHGMLRNYSDICYQNLLEENIPTFAGNYFWRYNFTQNVIFVPP